MKNAGSMNQHVWRLVLTVLGCAALAATGFGAEFFVNNRTGEDFYDGRSPQPNNAGSGPVRTIARALQLASGSDRITLAKTDEPYRESITLFGSRHSGLAGQPLVIAGNEAVLDGSQPVPPRQWQSVGGSVFRFTPPTPGPQQLFLDGRPAVRVPVGLDGQMPRLEPRQWCYHEGGILFKVEPTKLPADYNLSYAALPTGVTLYFVQHVAIVDLVVQGFRLDGIQAANTARNIYLAGIVARGNGRAGLTVGGASLVEIEACLAGANGAAQLITMPWSETQIRRCRLLGDSADGWVDRGGRVWIDGQKRAGGMESLDTADNEQRPAEQRPAEQPPGQ